LSAPASIDRWPKPRGIRLYLGISTSTFNRRVLPFIETLQMDWGTRLIPADELERVLSERRRQAEAERRPPARPGRKAGLPSQVVTRIREEYYGGKSLSQIARGLDADGVRTSQGGRQWWPSTVRTVLELPESPRKASGRFRPAG
jgi:hypothetical protein